MSEVTTFISELGVPVAMTVACEALVFFLLNWVKSTLIGTIKDMGDEIREELQKNERVAIKLIDKIALMHWSAIEQRCAIEEHLHNPVDYRFWSEATHKREELEQGIKKRNGSN